MAHRMLTAVLGLAVLALGTPTSAIEKCKVKIDRKTGEIQVSASAVTGVPTWGGGEPDYAANPFPELADCQNGTKLKSCRIGAAGSVAARRAPSSCTLSVADDAGSCQVYIPGCVASSMVAAYVSEVGQADNWALSRSYGAVGLVKGPEGQFEVEFDRTVNECFPSVTLFSTGHAYACVYCGSTDHHVVVHTTDVAGVASDLRFYLTMLCP